MMDNADNPQPTATGSRRWTIPAILALLAVAGYSAYWYLAARSLGRMVQDWADRQTEAGWTIAHGDVGFAGFPVRIAMRIKNPSITTPLGAWQGRNLSVSVAPFDPQHLRLSVRRDSHIVLGGSAWDVEASLIRADLAFGVRADRLKSLQVTASDVSLRSSAGNTVSAEALGLTLAPPETPPAGDRTPAALSFVATAAGVIVNEPAEGSGGEPVTPIAMAEASGKVMGKVPLASPAEAVSKWASDGGTVEFDHLVVDWPPVEVEADGTFALDPNGQPIASFSTRMRGLSQMIDNLKRSGTIDNATAVAARSMAAGQAKPDSKGRATLTLPMTLQDGKLWLGSVALAAVPPVKLP